MIPCLKEKTIRTEFPRNDDPLKTRKQSFQQDRINRLRDLIFPLTKSTFDRKGNQIQIWSVPESRVIAIIHRSDGSIRYICKIQNGLDPDDDPVTLHNRLLLAPDVTWDYVITESGSLIIMPHLVAAGWRDAIPRSQVDLSGLTRLARGRTREQMCEWFYKNGYELDPSSRHDFPKVIIHQREYATSRHNVQQQASVRTDRAAEPKADQHEQIREMLKNPENFIKTIQVDRPSGEGGNFDGGGLVFRHPRDKSQATFHIDYTIVNEDVEEKGGYHIDVRWHKRFKEKVKVSTHETYVANREARLTNRKEPYELNAWFVSRPHGPAQKQFEQTLQQTRLTKSYNSNHPTHPVASRGAGGGSIGGVGNEVGILLGLFDGLSAQMETEHAFFLPAPEGGKLSLTKGEIDQLLHELAVGIFVYDAVPFFSLHFNGDTNMYPVIHPAYQKTLVGHVISMLDYYMKGFLNGGFFNAEFVKRWNAADGNMNENTLKENVIDVRAYCQQHLGNDFGYQSIKEIIEDLELTEANQTSTAGEEENPILKDYSGFRSSFRIIAHQNSLKKTENLFLIDGDFDVLYTITPDPAYESELAKYRQITGMDPPAYKKLEKAYQQMAEQIKNIMPRLPEFKPLFEALNLTNFFCYYYNTLKQAGKFPLVNHEHLKVEAMCPPLFPHLPILKSYHQNMEIKLGDLIPGLQKSEILIRESIKTGKEQDAAIRSISHVIMNNVCSKANWTLSEKYRNHDFYRPLGDLIFNKLREEYQNNINVYADGERRAGALETNNLPILNKNIAELDTAQSPLNARKYTAQGLIEIRKELQKLRAHKTEMERAIASMRSAARTSRENPISLLRPETTVSLLIDDRILNLYREEEEGKRDLHKRVVGGCGVQLDSKPLSIDPTGNVLLDHLYGQILPLPIGEVLEIPSDVKEIPPGLLFKVGFSQLSVLEDQGKQMAMRYLCPPPDTFTEAHLNLFHSIDSSDENLFRATLDQITEWTFKDALGVSPLHYAVSSSPFILESLSRKIPISTPDPQGYTALHYAAQIGNLSALQTLLNLAPGLLESPALGGATLLYTAVQNNQLSIVRELVRRGANPNCKVAQGMNALMCAIHQGHVEIALELLQHPRIDLGATLDDKATALHLASAFEIPSVCAQLIAKGANVNAERWDKYTPLHVAAKRGNPTLVQLLAGAPGINLNARLKSGKTALHISAQEDHYNVVECLLKNGADATLFGWDRETAVNTAVRHGNIYSALLLLHSLGNRTMQVDGAWHTVIHFWDIRNDNPLKIASRLRIYELLSALFHPIRDDPRRMGIDINDLLYALCGGEIDPEIVKGYIDKYALAKPEILTKALQQAASNGNEATVYMLRSTYPTCDFRDDKGWTVFHWGAYFDHIFLFSELLQKNPSPVELSEYAAIAAGRGSMRALKLLLTPLLEKISQPEIGRLLLPAAVRASQHAAVDLIIHKILYPDISPDSHGRIAAHHAVIEGDLEMIELLRVRGAKYDTCDKEGLTPFHYAITFKRLEVLKYLLDPVLEIPVPPDLLYFACEQDNPEALSLLLKTNSNVDAINPKTGQTPITAAVIANSLDCVAILHARGASLTLQNASGRTPFLMAAQYSKPILQFLIQFCDLDQKVDTTKEGSGQTALHIAAENGQDACVELLLKAGLDNSVKCSKGKTPADYAEKKGFLDLKLLLSGVGEIEVRKGRIIQALLNENRTNFFELIESLPLHKPMTFNLPRGRVEIPLLHLIDICLPNAQKTPFLEQYSRLNGANFQVKTRNENTALHYTAERDQDPPSTLLPNALTPNKDRVTPFHLYAQSESLERFQKIYSTASASKNASFLEIEDREMDTPLFYAVRKKRLEIVEFLLEASANSNHRNKQLLTPLSCAVASNSLPLVKLLFKHGADLEMPVGIEKKSLLHISLSEGFKEITLWLLENSRLISKKDRQGRSPIHIAAQKGDLRSVRMLQACGAFIFDTDTKGNNLAFYAAFSKNVKLFEYLKVQGVSFDPVSSGKKTDQIAPLHVAALKGNIPVVSTLYHYGANMEAQDSTGSTALPYSAQSGNPEMLRLFSESPLIHLENQRLISLYRAIQKDAPEQLHILLKNSSNVDQRLDLKPGTTLLHQACIVGAIRVVLYLLQEGADPLLTTYGGTPPFAFAVMNNHVEVAKELATVSEIDMQFKMPDGKNYLHLASSKGNTSMMALLLNEGCPINEVDSQGWTPLHHAVVRKDHAIIRLLLCYGADPKVINLQGKTTYDLIQDPTILALMLSYEKMVSRCLEEGGGRLHSAVLLGDVDAVTSLLQIEDIEKQDNQGRTPLHYAATKRNLPLLRRIADNNPDLEAQDNQGQTPLCVAAVESKDPAIVQLFLDLGANPSVMFQNDLSLLEKVTQVDSSHRMLPIFTKIYGAIKKPNHSDPIHAQLRQCAPKGDLRGLFNALRRGASVPLSSTPLLHEVIGSEQIQMLRFLLDWFSFDFRSIEEQKGSLYDLAVQKKNPQILGILESNGFPPTWEGVCIQLEEAVLKNAEIRTTFTRLKDLNKPLADLILGHMYWSYVQKRKGKFDCPDFGVKAFLGMEAIKLNGEKVEITAADRQEALKRAKVEHLLTNCLSILRVSPPRVDLVALYLDQLGRIDNSHFRNELHGHMWKVIVKYNAPRHWNDAGRVTLINSNGAGSATAHKIEAITTFLDELKKSWSAL